LAHGFVDTCLHEKRMAKAVEAIIPTGRPTATWRVTTSVELVELPHGPINTPIQWKSEHTPHFGDSTCKTPILSVEARRSLVGRVARL
jgi:hypothetical protein